MKFIAGLLVGAIATLLVSSLATYRWETPSRLAVAVPSSHETNVEMEPIPTAPEPIRSVTIDPLPAPAPAPVPVAQRKPVPETESVRLSEPQPEPGSERSFAMAAMATSSEAPMSAALAEIETPVETAVVWKPFHSEVSATGFARRLSTQLGYPFRALREGPARYHVVFDYDTDQQRELLQQQVTALTGFDAI